MSTELNPVPANNGNDSVSVTSFFGGSDRGRCLQFTQATRNRKTGHPGHEHQQMFEFVQMTEEQVREAMARMQEWLDGNY